MKILHLVKIVFDKRRPEIDTAWIERRLQFCREWTCRSLAQQRFQHFGLWASCGVNMTPQDAMLVRQQLPTAQFITLNPGHAPDGQLRAEVLNGGYDHVYVTRCDSDDLLAPDVMYIVNEQRPVDPGRVEALMFRRGYMYDVRTGQLGVYHSPSSPFHTMMIPRDVFCDLFKYAAMNYGDHSRVNTDFPTQVMLDWRFTVLVHDGNFISTMDYAREHNWPVERNWSVDRFLDQPVVFDVDDFCDQWNCLPELYALKERYPNFRCTLFTIPNKTSRALAMRAAEHDWIELAVHGINHSPNEEMYFTSADKLRDFMSGNSLKEYVRGFRPPGWYVDRYHVQVLNDLGYWVALHVRDEKKLGPLCKHGYYICSESKPYWHGHTSGAGQKAHSVCGNGIRECLTGLLAKWPVNQKFVFVSDAVLIPQSEYNRDRG